VPETTLRGQRIAPAFYVGRWACSKSENGLVTVNPELPPWTHLTFDEAKTVCEASGFKLIAESQWLGLAHQLAYVPNNWAESNGRLFGGELKQGLRLDEDKKRTVPYDGNYLPTNSDEHRGLRLPNGEWVYDLNGNLTQWVFDDLHGDKNGLIASAIDRHDPSRAIAPFASQSRGMGRYPQSPVAWAAYALVRGGSFRSGNNAGLFALGVDWPSRRDYTLGFRCVIPAE
jgi:formylglycine-generating enzyme required for sulfatase activity